MRYTLLFPLCLLAAGCFSGCSTLMPRGSATPDVAAAAPQDTVQVVLKSTRGKTKKSELQLTEGMSVQTALEKTGAIRKFTDMDIKVYRVTPLSKGAVVPLQAEYDPSKNRVPILNDMALHPGDMVLVEEKDVSQLELAIAALTGNAAKRRGLD
jgi:hypothetical protein